VAIQEFNFNITHIAGEDNVVADYLSRLPSMEASSRTSVPTQNPSRLMMMHSGTVPSEDEIPLAFHEIISSVHNDIVGHNGVQNTLERLSASRQADAADQKTWRKYIRQFRQQCPTCQAGTNIKFTSAANPFTLAALHPMDKLAVDTIGPLPTDANGNGYIIVFIDAFTRFVELYAVPDTTAEICAGKLLDHVGRYGVPVLLQSDQGSQFVNQLIREFTELMGVKHHLTLQYSSESNGLVERANKEVMRHLRNIVFDRRCRDNFSTMLPLVQRIMNTAIHSVTKISPAQLLFGNAVNLDRDIFLPPMPPPEEARTFTAYMQGLINTQACLINIAKEHQQAHDLYHLASKDPGDQHTAYPIGAYVMAHYRKSLISRSGAPSKLHMPLRGPLQVIAVVGDTYTLQELVTNKTDDYHVTQIRPFVYDPKYNSPDEAARHNHGEYLVEQILDHRGSRHEKDTMEFLVKWAGYTEDENSWEPYSELKHNEQLHSYLETHRMRTLIPRSHK
jgi:transposase InsO family protein